MGERQPPSAADFDEWYANMVGPAPQDEIARRHLGLPAHLLSTSLLSWDGLAEVVAALRLAPGGRLLDLACGRGGYGLEIAARTGASLVGVDFSAVAVGQAADLADRLGVDARFQVGDLADTGLPAGSVDALVCIDSIQFRPGVASFAEMHRVLAPGGRLALTGWEPLDRSDERLPASIRAVDPRGSLPAAGFVDVEVSERPAWRCAERALWEEAAALDPGDDPGLRSFHEEGVRVLARFDLTRRILATATA